MSQSSAFSLLRDTPGLQIQGGEQADKGNFPMQDVHGLLQRHGK